MGAKAVRLPITLGLCVLTVQAFAQTATASVAVERVWKHALLEQPRFRTSLLEKARAGLASPTSAGKIRAMEAIAKTEAEDEGTRQPTSPQRLLERREIANALAPFAQSTDTNVSRAAIRTMAIVLHNRQWGLHGEPWSKEEELAPLFTLPRPALRPLLEMLLEKEPVHGVHITILRTLGQNPERASIPTLIAFAHGSIHFDNLKALEILCQFDDPRVLPAIVDGLGKEIPDYGNLVGELLLREYGRSAGPQLRRAVESHPDVLARVAALECLRTLGDPRNTPSVIRALSDPSDYVRSVACYALRAEGESRVVIPLRIYLSDSNPETRAAACEALAQYRVKSAAGAIRRLLKDSDSGVRASAARALETLARS